MSFTSSHHASSVRLMTLGWTQFVVLAVGLLTVAIVVAVLIAPLRS